MSNILFKADQIVNHRAEEKERQYGPFNESIERTAEFYNLMKPKTDPDISPEGVLRVLIALKLSREAYGHKEDNLLDGVAYIGALNNYIVENTKKNENINIDNFKLHSDNDINVSDLEPSKFKFICEANNKDISDFRNEKNIKT